MKVQQSQENIEEERVWLNPRILSETDQQKFEVVFRKGSAVYGNAPQLQKQHKRTPEKVAISPSKESAHTKYRQYRRSFPGLEGVPYCVDEVFSVDISLVVKLARHKNFVTFLLVARDAFFRKLRVLPM